MEDPPIGEDLTRDQVEALVARDLRWHVSYCSGAHREQESGRGEPLPEGVLDRVPTAAALAKVRRGQSRRTYFFAQLARADDDQVLRLTEE